VGPRPANVNGTFAATASLNLNLFDGGRSRADIEQAAALIRNRKNLLADMRGQIDYQVRNSLIDLEAAAEQVTIARDNLALANETLSQARTRFEGGVTDNIEVIQAQDTQANANASLTATILLHNLAKVSLARAIGGSEVTLKELLRAP